MKTNIFICYRREDSGGSAGRLYDSLTREFGYESIFRDVDSIEPGLNYMKFIESKLDECLIVLVVIGKNFCKISDKTGTARINLSDDLLNIEIGTALKKGKMTIPVLVDNAKMPTVNELPENLRELTYHHDIELRDSKWHRDFEELKEEISKIIEKIKQEEEQLRKKNEEEKLKKEAERKEKQQEKERIRKDAELKKLQEEKFKVEAEKKQAEKSKIKYQSQGNNKLKYIIVGILSILVIIILIWQPWKKNKENIDYDLSTDNSVEDNAKPENKKQSEIISIEDNAGYFIDQRDGQQYKTIKIGNQTWMAENLNYNAGSNCWCYDNKKSNCAKYGRLYSYKTAKNVCPSGWHLPSKAEFEILLNEYGSEENAYVALKKGGNSRFNALFVGWRSIDANYGSLGEDASIWSSSPGELDNAWDLRINGNNKKAYMDYDNRSLGFSVRCLQD